MIHKALPFCYAETSDLDFCLNFQTHHGLQYLSFYYTWNVPMRITWFEVKGLTPTIRPAIIAKPIPVISYTDTVNRTWKHIHFVEGNTTCLFLLDSQVWHVCFVVLWTEDD